MVHEERGFQQEVEDKNNARAREIAIANSGASPLSKNMTAYMALMIVASTFILCTGASLHCRW